MSFDLDSILNIFPYFMLGFISIKIWEFITPTSLKKASEIYMEILLYGIIYKEIYDFFNRHITLIIYHKTINISKIIILSIVILTPFIIKFILNCNCIKSQIVNTTTPTAWDYFFLKKECCYIEVHFTNGEIPIIGLYGIDSYISSYPKEKDIYLEKVYTKNNDGTLEEIKETRGVYIPADNIRYVLFWKYEIEEGDE